MSDPTDRELRPLAKALPTPSPFGALIAAAGADPDAAQGFAQAYIALGVDERAQLLEAVLTDARSEGLSPGRALAALLAAERDPALVRRIAAALVAAGGAALAPGCAPQALLGGDAAHGGALLARPLYGEFSEVLVLRWLDGRGFVQAEHVPLVRSDRARGETCRLPLDLRLADVEVGAAVEAVRAAAATHLALHGALPRGLERFEDWLGVGGS